MIATCKTELRRHTLQCLAAKPLIDPTGLHVGVALPLRSLGRGKGRITCLGSQLCQPQIQALFLAPPFLPCFAEIGLLLDLACLFINCTASVGQYKSPFQPTPKTCSWSFLR